MPNDQYKDLFVENVCNTFDELKNLFLQKSEQYSTLDPLANFRHGAALRLGHDPEYNDMYNEAKNYAAKHVAHVYSHGIEGNKVDESLKDIAVYCIIMLYMRKRHMEIHAHERK